MELASATEENLGILRCYDTELFIEAIKEADTNADFVLAYVHWGTEYYSGKPIVYSLGNYWFNEKTLDTMLLDLHFYGDEEEQFLENISVNVSIDENGKVLYDEEY